jgi:hypothetical protein
MAPVFGDSSLSLVDLRLEDALDVGCLEEAPRHVNAALDHLIGALGHGHSLGIGQRRLQAADGVHLRLMTPLAGCQQVAVQPPA